MFKGSARRNPEISKYLGTSFLEMPKSRFKTETEPSEGNSWQCFLLCVIVLCVLFFHVHILFMAMAMAMASAIAMPTASAMAMAMALRSSTTWCFSMARQWKSAHRTTQEARSAWRRKVENWVSPGGRLHWGSVGAPEGSLRGGPSDSGGFQCPTAALGGHC